MGKPYSHGYLALACSNSTNVARKLIEALKESGEDNEWTNGTVRTFVNDALKNVVELQGQLHRVVCHLDQEAKATPATEKKEEATSSLLVDNGTELVGAQEEAFKLLDTLAGALEQAKAGFTTMLGCGMKEAYGINMAVRITDIDAALSRFKAYKEGV